MKIICSKTKALFQISLSYILSSFFLNANASEKIAANDPRVVRFPEFAALGEMHLVGSLLFSARAPSEMDRKQAGKFCARLDRGRNFANPFRHGKAMLPTLGQWKKMHEVGTELPGRFWARDLVGHMYDWSYATFSPSTGSTELVRPEFSWPHLLGLLGREKHSVSCVREVNWK